MGWLSATSLLNSSLARSRAVRVPGVPMVMQFGSPSIIRSLRKYRLRFFASSSKAAKRMSFNAAISTSKSSTVFPIALIALLLEPLGAHQACRHFFDNMPAGVKQKTFDVHETAPLLLAGRA